MAEETKTVEVLTLKNILGQSDNEAQNRRTERVLKSSKMDYQAVIDARTKKVFKLQNELESMNDISASNSSLSKNAIEPTTFDSEAYVKSRCKLLLSLSVEEAELAILIADSSFYE